jgi:GDP-L-fucose synthase
MREFLYVDDMAQASIFLMNLEKNIYETETQPMLSHINVGSGIDCTIKELTATVAKVIGYTGDIHWDITKPDGAPRKLMDCSLLDSLGWKAKITLEEGIYQTYSWFLENQDNFQK